MEARLFAEKYGLKAKRDECGELIIPGRVGQIYEYGSGRFGALFMPPGDPRPRAWGNFRRKLLAAGFHLLQNGDAEGCLLFHATDAAQARPAIRAIGAKARRKPSEAQLAVLRRARMAKRPDPRSIWPEPPAPGAPQRQISIRTGQAGVLASSVERVWEGQPKGSRSAEVVG